LVDDNGASNWTIAPEEKMGCQDVAVTGKTVRSSSVTPAGANSAPTLNASQRKEYPLASGVLDYFPDALMEVAHCSWVGNQQHNPGQPLHWAKEKSTDEPDALMRHLKDRGTLDSDGVRHSAKVAWRALAMLQREIEAERGV
jgi:hypothetical protein